MSNNPEGFKKSSLFHVLIIATLAIGLYLNTLKNGFVYDDESTIVKNTLIKNFDNLPLLFDKTAYFSRSGEMSYRPVVTFTYFIDYALYGLNPWGYHLTNVLLHALNGALLYLFLNLLLTPHSSRFTSPPFLISILFVAHPVLTEAVNCISYREDLFVFLFYIVALSLYLKLRQPTSAHRPLATALLYLFSCLTYLLSLLSKEMAVTLPLIVLCYEWLYGKNLSLRLFNHYIIGYLTITIFYLYLRFNIFHNPEEQIRAWGLVEIFLTLPWLIMNYLRLSLFPVQLSADYVINPINSPLSFVFILPIIALVLVFSVIFIMGLREKNVLFGAFFFIVALTPVYNLVPIVNPFAERYIYLPMIGFVMLTGSIAYLIVEKLKIRPVHRNRHTLLILLFILILSFSTIKRNAIWRDNHSLWANTVVAMPDSGRAHRNLGIAYSQQGLFDQAIKEFFIAIRLEPDDATSHYNFGVVYLKQGFYDDAINEFTIAVKLKPDYKEAFYNLEALMKKKKGY